MVFIRFKKKMKHIYKYSYEGKLEKNRKKNIYITQLKKKYFRCLKEYEKKHREKMYCAFKNNEMFFPCSDAECSFFFQDSMGNGLQYKNNLFLEKKQKGFFRSLKDGKKTKSILEKRIRITQREYEEKKRQWKINQRRKRYKIMTQLTKKGQPKLNKRIDLLLERVRGMIML
ncbi:hypothetical protein PCK1_002001 [Pneumocystis canis]|nr:hypothetical protein PCK1_002001 [Pneumocystis canis]